MFVTIAKCEPLFGSSIQQNGLVKYGASKLCPEFERHLSCTLTIIIQLSICQCIAGPLCASCVEGYSVSQNFECQECWSTGFIFLVSSISVLVMLITVVFLARKAIVSAEAVVIATGDDESSDHTVTVAMTAINMIQVTYISFYCITLASFLLTEYCGVLILIITGRVFLS